MKVKFWGIRGSNNIAKSSNLKYGCNTTCIEVNSDDGDIFIFDAGTGLSNLGDDLLQRDIQNKVIHILLTHAHWDHIIGLPNFNIIFQKDWTINFYAVKGFGAVGVKEVYDKLFDMNQWPMPKDSFSQNIFFHEFDQGGEFYIGKSLIKTVECNHPGGDTGYRINNNEWSVFFSGDHEHTKEYDDTIKNFIKGVDVAIVDASYTAEDYQNCVGWGHTAMDTWVELTEASNIKNLIFTHYATNYNDKFIDSIIPKYTKLESPNMLISFAYEGLEIGAINKRYPEPTKNSADWILKFIQKVSTYNDITTVLDTILTEARQISKADAGTIYLSEDDNILSFEYTQNDTLFSNTKDNKHLYVNAKIPINNSSIAGYVANNSKLLNIEDVYKLENTPYSFNSSFDEATGYKTKSMLSVPIIGQNSKVIGVLQLINSIDNGKKVMFTKKMVEKIQLLSVIVINTLQRSQMSTELVIRMLDMSKLKDPKETGSHVKRVGTVAAEIYMEWARRNNIDNKEAKLYQDQLRIAAMLHDVGKVGIPDAILKKPAKLTEDEFKVMEKHCYIGANLFAGSSLPLDNMAYEIAQHHHQRYNGKGYTGSSNIAILKGKEIPLAARITSIADVYDALVSKRCYKEAFETNYALDILNQEAGEHFDPELINCFMSILPTIYAIYEKFTDEEDKE